MGQIRNHIRVIEGRPWKQALVCAMNPGAPYQPWDGAEAVELGDTVVVVIDTEPQTALCAFTYSAMLDVRHSIMAECRFGGRPLPTAAELEGELGLSLADRNGLPLPADTATTITNAVNLFDPRRIEARTGDSSATVARIMASSRALCTCCDGDVELNQEDDLDRLIHTASADDTSGRSDCPALLCTNCYTAMREASIRSVTEFVFSRRPVCPTCGARKARSIGYGMPSYEWIINMPHWESSGGCVVGPDSAVWACGGCGHEWS